MDDSTNIKKGRQTGGMSFLQDPQTRRWYIVVTIFVAIICNYLDRQLLSILKPVIKDTFEFGDEGYALIVNIFLICYAVMYPVSGWLTDRFGPKRIMLIGIMGWSLACIGGGLSTNVWQFAICRGVLGLAEPTIFAGQIVAVTVWFAGKQRATVNSFCAAGGSIGTVIAPVLIAWLSTLFPWQEIFVIAGAFGLLIGLIWWSVYRNPPKEMMQVALQENKANESSSATFSWWSLWKTRSLWGCLLIRFISDPVWYFCLFWLPGYLQEDSGLTLLQVGWVGWIPFFIGATGGILTSCWSDYMVRKGMSLLRARKIMMSVVALLAPVCILVPYLHSVAVILALFSVISVVCLSWLFTINVVIAESFPVKNVASVVGITAGFGAVGGACFNYYVGQLIGSIGSGNIFLVMGALHIVCIIILWKMTRPEIPVKNETMKTIKL
ncbi:MAG: MFS transporter [Bacteroidales bacterium]|jgi:ACS family hexuronate transporter-like MFS transporter|nr:MFS transporter [Bacteroidales bacterium]